MKISMPVALIGLAALGFASCAEAYTFSPAPTKFTATGPASATLNGETLNGTGAFKGDLNKHGKAKITTVKFCGAGGCDIVGVAGLPWAMKATGASTATIANVTFTSPGGDCGPANLLVNVSGGVISYDGAFDQCSNVSLSLSTQPALSIIR